MGVTVGYSVGETSVLIVGVVVSVGLGGVIRLNPPHPMRKKVNADTPTRTLLVIVSRIHITEVSVSFRCDGWIYRG
jgi:hypothetical protein